MRVTCPHGLCQEEPKEALVCKPRMLVVLSVERGGVTGGSILARELGAAWEKHGFHWLLPTALCIAQSESLHLNFHRR